MNERLKMNSNFAFCTFCAAAEVFHLPSSTLFSSFKAEVRICFQVPKSPFSCHSVHLWYILKLLGQKRERVREGLENERERKKVLRGGRDEKTNVWLHKMVRENVWKCVCERDRYRKRERGCESKQCWCLLLVSEKSCERKRVCMSACACVWVHARVCALGVCACLFTKVRESESVLLLVSLVFWIGADVGGDENEWKKRV